MRIAWKWIVPVGLALLGIVLMGYDPVNFLGIMCLGMAALLCAFFLLAGRQSFWAGMAAKALRYGVYFAVLVCLITGCFVASGHPSPAWQSCDYILVLGCSIDGEKPGSILQNRIDTAYAYLTEHPDTIAVLTGGKGNHGTISEAQCMFNELTAMGIDGSRLWLEERATSTKENFWFSVERIVEETGSYPQQLGVLSSETHLFRASMFADQVGVDSVGIAARTTNPIYYVNYFLREIPCIWNLILFGG